MPMPKTTVDEDDCFPFGKHKIGAARKATIMKAKAEAHSMSGFSN